MSEFKGRCFCGAVEIHVAGEPVAAGYCHCTSCRRWSASPVNAFTLWKPESLTVTRGSHMLGEYTKTPRSTRKWCTACGGHVFTVHPEWGVVDVYASTLLEFPFKAGVHVNYAEAVLPVRDGLPKLADYPKEMGGSGAMLPE